MLPIIDRYILREAARSFSAIIVVLMLIVVSQSYIQILQEAAAGQLGNQVLMQLLGLEVLQVLGPVIPPTFFFAILYSLGRMYRDSEMTALCAGGVGPGTIYRAFFLAALPVTLLVAWLTLGLLPWVNLNKAEIERSQQDRSAELSLAVAGRFNEFREGDLVFYVQEMSPDRQKLRNIFVQNRQHGKLGLTAAAEGYHQVDEHTGDQYLVLNRGHRYEGVPGSNDYSVGSFEKYAVRIERKKTGRDQLPAKAKPTLELMRSEIVKEQSEFQYRLMLPIAVLVFTALSIPLSRSLPREGIYGRLMLAILFYFVFFNLQAVSGSWMVAGVTPPWLGRWWVHPVMLLLGWGAHLYQMPPRRSTAGRGLRRRPA